MSPADLQPCAECGARPKRREDRFCAFCGTELPHGAPALLAPRAERAVRFEATRHLPAHADALGREPSTAHIVAGGMFSAIFFVFFAFMALGIGGIGGSLGASSGVGHGFGGLFVLVPIVMAVIALGVAVKRGALAVRVVTSPTQRRLALARDRRTQVSGGSDNSSASTRYFVTLEYEDGRREDHPVDRRIAGRVVSGDLGVAYERGGILVDFERLDA